jgi:hypothetical protein
MFLKKLIFPKRNVLSNFSAAPANGRSNESLYVAALDFLKTRDEGSPRFPAYDLRYLLSFRE